MNLPFDPSAPVVGTNSLQVGMVRRVSDNKVFDVSEWFSSMTQGEIHALRPRMRRGLPDAKFVCFCCGHDVHLRKHISGGHCFVHKEKTTAEKSKCLYQQERGPSLADLDRLRYQGQREGSRHIRTKELIERILRADTRFAKPVIEKRWTSFADGWRKPDVASVWGNLAVVFEAQVSNTYPQIVAERTDFYRKKDALLIWIFDLLPDTHWRTLHADTFCSNEQHLFLVDEECATVSEEFGQAHFRIYSLRPEAEPIYRLDDERFVLRTIQEERCALVPFASLSLDANHQTAILFNVAEESRRVMHKVLCAKAQAGAQYAELEKAIQNEIQSKRPIDRKNVEGWAALICAIESKRLGRPIGTGFKEDNVAGVLNLVHDHHPTFFPCLVRTLERLNLDPPEQRRGAWKSRVEAFHRGRYKEGPIQKPHQGSERLLAWLYPS
jgi:hypothetical protein